MLRPENAGPPRMASETYSTKPADMKVPARPGTLTECPTAIFAFSPKSRWSLLWQVFPKLAIRALVRGPVRQAHVPLSTHTLPPNLIRCSALNYPASAAPSVSGRHAQRLSGSANAGIFGIHLTLADSAPDAGISGRSLAVSSAEECLRTETGTWDNEAGEFAFDAQQPRSQLPEKSGGLNRSTQHSAQTHIQ
jgi:hypothetical protein